MTTGRSNHGGGKLGNKELRRLVEEAVVDCHDEEEQVMGLLAMIEDNLSLPFETTVLGARVTVECVEMVDPSRIVAICARREHRQAIPLLDLPLPEPPPAGAEWIAAYRYWACGE